MKAESATASWKKPATAKPITHEIKHGDCLTELRRLADKSVDAIVTDPPAGISFMGKSWDGDKGGRDEWIKWLSGVFLEAWRVLKPGGHCLVWALPRTSHWTATAIEDAGFEVRDIVTHLFGTGFPKSLDVSKAIDKKAGAKREIVGSYSQHDIRGGNLLSRRAEAKRHVINVTAPSTHDAKKWAGFGTALKPASEHWILARRPLSEATVADNVRRWGVGALNIDGCRIDLGGKKNPSIVRRWGAGALNIDGANFNPEQAALGRFPANLILDEEAAALLDEQTSHLHSAGFAKPDTTTGFGGETSIFKIGHQGTEGQRFGDSGGASRFFQVIKHGAGEFFYCAKPSRAEKGETNSHSTVKSIKLMSYLIGIVTAPGQTVLDMFAGSGTTLLAARACGRSAIGIEREAEYVEIIKTRLNGQ